MELTKISLGEDAGRDNSDAFSSSSPSRFSLPQKLGGGKKVIIVSALLLIIVLAIAIILPMRGVIASASKTYMQAKVAFDAIKKQDIGRTKDELKKTREDFVQTQEALKGLSWTQYIPLLGIYYKDAEHGVNAASAALDADDTIVDAILPYADVLGLKGQGSFVLGSAEDRIQKAVATMDKITPQLPTLDSKMRRVEDEISQIDPNRYPTKIGNIEIRATLTKMDELAKEGRVAVSDARPLLEVLPSLLGEPKEKKYLVIFQNDKELRPSGGFITAYAIFRIEHGVVHLDGTSDIYDLDNSILGKPQAPELILKYLPLVSQFNLRDSNISPDFRVSMNLFEGIYDKVPGKTAVDGIIAVDTHVLLTVLNILGPTQAGGVTYSTANDARCNCPQVIYALEDYSSRPVGYVRQQRKDIIGVLLYEIMRKALSSSTKLYWGPLFQSGISEIGQKHILFYMHDDKAQTGLENLNAAGRIREYDGDYLHINDSNFAGAKSNLYVQEKVNQKVDVANDGTVKETILIDYTNPQPPSDCNLESGGLCLNGLLRDVVRVYVPKGSQLIESRGSEVKVETKEDLGKTYFESFITVRPQGKASLAFTYTLPFKLAKGSPYLLLIQKQPGTDQNEYMLTVGGHQEAFKLTSDQEFKVKL